MEVEKIQKVKEIHAILAVDCKGNEQLIFPYITDNYTKAADFLRRAKQILPHTKVKLVRFGIARRGTYNRKSQK